MTTEGDVLQHYRDPKGRRWRLRHAGDDFFLERWEEPVWGYRSAFPATDAMLDHPVQYAEDLGFEEVSDP